jgi:N-terminal region of Chorein or VPS13
VVLLCNPTEALKLSQEQKLPEQAASSANMFEKWIASILSRVLGEYVEASSFNQETVHIGVWKGESLLRSL